MILTIDRLGHLGDGVAQGPDGPVFVPQALPGEVIEGDIQGDAVPAFRIVTPSVNRVRPPCAHARTCGGCLMQHAADPFVEDWKQGIVRGALAGQGLDAPFRPTLTSPPQSRRRATLAARKTKGGALLGFHARGSDVIIPIPPGNHIMSGTPVDIVIALTAIEAVIAIAAVHAELLAARTAGAAILLISEDLDEAVGLSDRLQAISKGRLSEPIRAEEVDARRLGLMMAGVWETRDAV